MDTGDSTRRWVPLALLAGVAAISFAAIFFKKAEPTHPLVAAGIRLAASSVVLLPWTLSAARRGRLTRRLVRAGALAGGLYGLHFGAWVWSLGLTTVAASVTLVTATPLLLAVVALLTGRDRPDRRTWWAIGLAIVGVTTIAGTDLGTSTRAVMGDLLALIGAGAMVGYLLVARRLGGALVVLPFAGIATAVGGGVLLIGAFASGVPLEAASPRALGYLLLAALVPQLIGHNLLTWSLRHTRPVVVGLATVGEPVGATLLAWLWLGEGIAGTVALGCALTLVAVVLAVLR